MKHSAQNSTNSPMYRETFTTPHFSLLLVFFKLKNRTNILFCLPEERAKSNCLQNQSPKTQK
uniref:Uncharacterized protein n=1 Tax=Rhizophora mucronata TaxID=61149 RepID=A0A2P2QMM1_RHIMU